MNNWEIDLLPNGTIGIRVKGAGAAEDLKAICPKPIRWMDSYGAYSLPLKWESCTGARQVADKHGAKLAIGADLAKWAREEKERIAQLPDVNSFALVALSLVAQESPRLAEAMSNRPFQTVGAAFAARSKSALIADDPGLGKTLQSIGAVIEADIAGLVLVVAPKQAVYDTWPRELALWSPGDEVVIIGAHLKPAARKTALEAALKFSPVEGGPKRLWVLTTPNYLRAKVVSDAYGKYVYGPKGEKQYKTVGEALGGFFETRWGAIVVDESHRTLAAGTGNAKKFSAQRQGMDMLSIRDGGLKLALSGTPFRGKREYAYGTLAWLRPDLYTSYWSWVKRFFDVQHDGYGMTVGRLHDEAGFYDDLSRVMVRRTKAEVAADLPPKAYAGTPLVPGVADSPHAVWLSMGPEQQRIYDQMTDEALAKLEGGELMANGILAIMTRLKQFACSGAVLVGDDTVQPQLPSNKFDWLVEWLDERGLNAETTNHGEITKVIVSSQFSKLLNLFAAELSKLGIETHLFTGDTKDEDRKAIIEDFQNNADSKVRVLLLTTTAGGVSLTLDRHCDDLILLDETWSPSDTIQLEDRIHRLSNTEHRVTIWKLKTLGTIEESIAATLNKRDADIRSLIDGQRGVETARELLNG